MKDSRKGETLWSEWFGIDYKRNIPNSLIFYTEEHVYLDNEIVKRALASALQRDGTTDSLGGAFRLLDGVISVHHGHAGYNAEGVIPITWVEIDVN